MTRRTLILTSATIGGLLGGLMGGIYMLVLPALWILADWATGNTIGEWSGSAYAPYSIIVCAVIGAGIGVFVGRRTYESRAARVGLVLVFAMAGAGCGTGAVAAFVYPLVILIAFLGANIGLMTGALFGLIFAALDKFTGISWGRVTRHCVCLRLVASVVSSFGVMAIYLGIHIHEGIAPAASLSADYLVAPLIILVLTALPVWLFGPETQRYYRSA